MCKWDDRTVSRRDCKETRFTFRYKPQKDVEGYNHTIPEWRRHKKELFLGCQGRQTRMANY